MKFLFVFALVFSHSLFAAPITVDDLAGGYLIAHKVDEDYTIELRLQKSANSRTLTILSMRDGSSRQVRKDACQGRAFVKGNRMALTIKCGKDEFTRSTILPDGDLKAGVPISFQNVDLSTSDFIVTKSKKPYFK